MFPGAEIIIFELQDAVKVFL